MRGNIKAIYSNKEDYNDNFACDFFFSNYFCHIIVNTTIHNLC